MDKIYKVSEFNEFINNYLGEIGEVVVEGEISKIDINQNKWVFATIKDKETSVSVFGLAFRIKNLDVLEEGMLVHIYGIPRLYKKTGRFSIFASLIVPAGEGAIRIAFEKLKLKLEKEGLFDEARKRPLPMFPQRIGLITAKNSEAYSDFIKVLTARMGGIKIYFYPVQVQGRNSVASLVRAFDYFNHQPLDLDLLAVVRGGGSLEDLQSFNDEEVVRAIFGSKIPVVSGVGHEKDITLTDLVADLRASTPSNAAELVVKTKNEVLKEIDFCVSRMESGLKNMLNNKLALVDQSVGILKSVFSKRVNSFHQLIFRFEKIFYGFKQKIQIKQQRLNELKKELNSFMDFRLKETKTKITSLIRLLGNLDYQRILKKGFSITSNKKGKIIKTIKDAANKDEIITRLFSGKIYSKIFNMEARLHQS